MISGDFASLDRLAVAAGRLAKVPALASLRVAQDVEGLIQEEFDSGTDPYGTAWQRLSDATVAKGRTAPPLTDTGDMRGSLNVYARREGGVAVTISHPSAPHQTGWKGSQGEGPSRPILPARDRIPATWEMAIEEAVTEAIDAELSGVFR